MKNPSDRFSAATTARPFAVSRYFWVGLVGASGQVISANPARIAGCR